MIRQSDSRLAPVKAWLMCLALSKRHEKLKAHFARYREAKSRVDAVRRIQKGWRSRPKGKKYETLIAAIKKHRGMTLHKVVAKRKQNAGPLLQRWLIHVYRNKRFTGWGEIIMDRTVKAQRVARSYLRCTEHRTRAMLLLWDKRMETEGGRSKLETMRKEILGDEGGGGHRQQTGEKEENGHPRSRSAAGFRRSRSRSDSSGARMARRGMSGAGGRR